MKKKLRLFNKILLILTCALLLGGCASLDYIGDDYSSSNVKPVQTNEGFYFSTYKKVSQEENIEVRMGLTKTSVPEVLVLYFSILNKGNSDYIVYLKDFKINKDYEIIPPSSYINAYQSQETGTYAGMQALAPTISNLATISNNFQPTGQESAVHQQNLLNSTNYELSSVTESIMKKSLNNACVAPRGVENSYYIFLKANNGDSKVDIQYKDLVFSFGKKTNSK